MEPNTPSGDIAIVLGTRPEIIKLASVIQSLGPRARVIHTGQHWDEAMAGQFFRDLGLGTPDVRLTRMSGASRGHQIANGISELTDHFAQNRPSAVIVQGDTNSTSAGAQAANYAGIPVIHVEAGLRSHDRAMPEELNRCVVGALSDIHCAATEHNRQNLLDEGIDADRITVTGNTIIEATHQALEKATKLDITFRDDSQTQGQSRVLATIHRPENTDSRASLERILRALATSGENVLLALHPRTEAAIDKFGLKEWLRHLDVRIGLGHAEFIALARQSDLLVSDSGGVQEEATVLRKPLLVVRNSTERPEAMEAGFAILVTPTQDLCASLRMALQYPLFPADSKHMDSPYGTGTAGIQIAQIACKLADVT
ncbi:non-hydrolyzing UDP-N-acetylglucosamine 2-epimerase [Paeniglutamicibacter sp. NPDC012692]|uniref:non-hydrolyzing UDP-N-acetylglucosamine 2-epimerase n=1 Tax=Paeniglutamicibacter sp. NPDC012692 TaxID=3364388 RepID=UPI0036C3D8A5